MDSNEKVVGGAFLGLVLFGWFIWMLSKVVASVFHDLGIMFDAIGTATFSFLAMAWALAQFAAILVAGTAVVYAAYRHYQLVKQATEIIASVEARCEALTEKLSKSQSRLESRVHENVNALRAQLEEVLAAPEVGPEEKMEDAPPPEEAALEIETVNEIATTPRVSSPY